MNLEKKCSANRLDVAVEGILDSLSSPVFETEVISSLDNIIELYIDIGNVEYVSSAGLRTFLYLYQIMSSKGKMVIQNVPEAVHEVFTLTGFYKVVTVE